MSKFLYPSEYYSSTYAIDFEQYYAIGYRAVLFDIDNTLVPHNNMSDKRSKELISKLRRIGFVIAFVSNNKEPRVANFTSELNPENTPDIIYEYKVLKPKKIGYTRALERLDIPREKALFVGDQLFTDIWGANNAGIHSILVDPIDKKEEIQIVLKRLLEKPVKLLYLRHHKMR